VRRTTTISFLNVCGLDGLLFIDGAAPALREQVCLMSPTDPSRKLNRMDNSTKDQAQGKLHEVKGAVKEKIGELTNNPDLQD